MIDVRFAPPGQPENAGDRARDFAQGGLHGFEAVWNYAFPKVAGIEITVGDLIIASVTLMLTWLASIAVRRSIARLARRNPNTNSASLYTVTRLAQYVVMIIGVLLSLSAIGVSFDKFAVLAGALGVGLGFGLQAIFSNFISGLILLFDKSLKVGDFVELESGVHGEVRDIKIRATTIVTNDNIDILVPNSEFVTGRVVSWTHREVSRRQRIPFGVAYGTDKELVKRAALEAAKEVPFTLSQDGPRGPKVWLTAFGDSSLNFELVIWLTAEATKRPAAVKAAYNWALHTALQKYDIEIPFPQRDLNVRSLFGREGARALETLQALARGEATGRHDGAMESPDADRPHDDDDGSNDAVEEVEAAPQDEVNAGSNVRDLQRLTPSPD